MVGLYADTLDYFESHNIHYESILWLELCPLHLSPLSINLSSNLWANRSPSECASCIMGGPSGRAPITSCSQYKVRNPSRTHWRLVT